MLNRFIFHQTFEHNFFSFSIIHDLVLIVFYHVFSQQQQRQQHLSSTLTGGIQVRPPPPEYPPPEYKATQAQAVHAGVGVGQQPRLSAPMRRVNQQPIPPSGTVTYFFKYTLSPTLLIFINVYKSIIL